MIWEDIAAFEIDETPYLLVGAIGDNQSRYPSLTLYAIEDYEWEVAPGEFLEKPTTRLALDNRNLNAAKSYLKK